MTSNVQEEAVRSDNSENIKETFKQELKQLWKDIKNDFDSSVKEAFREEK